MSFLVRNNNHQYKGYVVDHVWPFEYPLTLFEMGLLFFFFLKLLIFIFLGMSISLFVFLISVYNKGILGF